MTDWPLVIDGREFSPVPETWVEHGHDDGHGVSRIYAVSAAVTGRDVLHVRYISPKVPKALRAEMKGSEGPSGGIVPSALKKYHTWPRSITPDGAGPSGAARDAEVRHLRDLWGDEVEDVPSDKNAIADGGQL